MVVGRAICRCHWSQQTTRVMILHHAERHLGLGCDYELDLVDLYAVCAKNMFSYRIFNNWAKNLYFQIFIAFGVDILTCM